MNVSSPTCWERFKASCCCCCLKPRTLRRYRSAARLDQRVEKSVSSVVLHTTTLEVKKHHVFKSTDQVTVLECIKQDKEWKKYVEETNRPQG